MYRWNETIQEMINWIEEHLTENPSLLEMSNQIGYSPYYCSSQFHSIVGMTIKSYISGRRLAKATLEIRDTKERILDIALKYGYSSQEALTRAFVNAYGCTPSAYRKNPIPVPLSNLQVVFYHEHYMDKGEPTMNKTLLKEPSIRIEHIPEHKYIGIWDINASDYMVFFHPPFDYLKDCGEVMGRVENLAWNFDPKEKGYEWNEEVCQDYQRHYPEEIGYEVLRPIKKCK